MPDAGVQKKTRLGLLDTIRGLTLVSMIGYHFSWDLVYLARISWPWYASRQAFYWQQSICWTFILLSGLCTALSRHRIRRGLVVSLSGLLVTLVTLIALPQDRVVFGVLTFIGAAMLFTGLLKPLEKIPPLPGILGSLYLFFVLYPVNTGVIQFLPGVGIFMPSFLYRGLPMTFLGFMDPSFFSTDYFSFLPWIFLFLAGMYLGRWLKERDLFKAPVFTFRIPPLAFLGEHSLLIYLLHQPVLYLVTLLVAKGR